MRNAGVNIPSILKRQISCCHPNCQAPSFPSTSCALHIPHFHEVKVFNIWMLRVVVFSLGVAPTKIISCPHLQPYLGKTLSLTAMNLYVIVSKNL